MNPSQIEQLSTGFKREVETGRAQFDKRTLDEWQKFGGGDIEVAPDAFPPQGYASISPYELYVNGAKVEPFLDRNFVARIELSLWRGSMKYGRGNFKLGGYSRGRVFNAIIRHAVQWLMGCKKEDHLSAIVDNVLMAWWSDEHSERKK